MNRRRLAVVCCAVALCLLSSGVWLSYADLNRYCPNPRVNAQGTSNQDITIDATAGGILILAQDPNRCSAMIINVTNPIRCGPSTGAGAMTVTSTAGLLLSAGAGIGLSVEDGVTEAWKCIRTTASSSTVSVVEGRLQ